MKPFAHAVIIAGILNAASLFRQPEGVRLGLRLVEPGAYTIFAASTAAALHQRKAVVLLILGLTVMIGYPFDLPGFARLLVPQGIGIIAGSLARKLFMEERNRRHDTATTDR